MSHQSALTRQWILLQAVSARRYGATVKELAEEHEVSLKTIRRDLVMLQSAGLPLEETVVEHGLKRWRIDPERWKGPLGFAFDEAAALYVARRLLEPLAGTPFWNAAQSALKKTRSTLSEAALSYLDRFGETFHRTRFGESDYRGKAAVVEQLNQGIDDRCEVGDGGYEAFEFGRNDHGRKGPKSGDFSYEGATSATRGRWRRAACSSRSSA